MPSRLQEQRGAKESEFASDLDVLLKKRKKEQSSEEEFASSLDSLIPKKPGFFQSLAGQGLEGLSSVAGLADLAAQELLTTSPTPGVPLRGGVQPGLDTQAAPAGPTPLRALEEGLHGAAEIVYPEEQRGHGGAKEQIGGVFGSIFGAAPFAAMGGPVAAFAYGAQTGLPLYYEIKAKTGNEEAAGWALMLGTGIGQFEHLGVEKYAGDLVKKLFTGKLGKAVEKTVIQWALSTGTGALGETTEGVAQQGLTDLVQEHFTKEDLDNWGRMREAILPSMIGGATVKGVHGAFAILDNAISRVDPGKLKTEEGPKKPPSGATEKPAPQASQEAPEEGQGKPTPEEVAWAKRFLGRPEEKRGVIGAPDERQMALEAAAGAEKAAGRYVPEAPKPEMRWPMGTKKSLTEPLETPAPMPNVIADRLDTVGKDYGISHAERMKAFRGLEKAMEGTWSSQAALNDSARDYHDKTIERWQNEGLIPKQVPVEPTAAPRTKSELRGALDSAGKAMGLSDEALANAQRRLAATPEGFDPEETFQHIVIEARRKARKTAKENANPLPPAVHGEEVPSTAAKTSTIQPSIQPGGTATPSIEPRAEISTATTETTKTTEGTKEPSGIQQLYGGVPTIPGTEGAIERTKAFLVEKMRSRGHAPEDARRFLERAQGERNAEGIEVRKNSRDLARAAKEAYGDKWLETHGEMLDRALKSPEWLAALPEKVQAPLAAIRDHIDRLSRRMIESGAATGPVARTIESNLGRYATKVHRAFVDPKWKKKVPEEVRNRLLSLWTSWSQPISAEEMKALEMRAREKPPEALSAMKRRREINREIDVLQRVPRGTPDGDAAQRKIQILRKERRSLSSTAKKMTEASRLARNEVRGRKEFAGASETDIKHTMSAILEAARKKADNPFAQIAVGKLGRKDLSILRRRKQFPQELHDFLGEIKSPLASYAASVAKMAQNISLHEAYSNIRDSGLGFWLFDPKTQKNIPESHDAKISSEGNAALAPLDGLYTTPEIEKALREVEPREVNVAFRAMMKLNAFIKWGKIVGAPHQIPRQFIGNPIQNVRNGHGWALVNPEIIGKVKDSFSDLSEQKRLARLGISGESIAAEEFKTLKKYQRLTPEEVAANENNPWSMLGNGKELAEKAYQTPDEIQRRLGFYAEEKMRLDEGLSPAAAEEAAANFVRDHYPTWSRILPIFKAIRKIGFLGGYFSFKAEQFRNFGNLLKTVKAEISSDNPKVKARGYKRLVGVAVSQSIIPAIALAYNGLTGVDKDEDRLRKEFIPPWDQDGQIAWKGDNLKGSYVKPSDTDPGSMFTDPLIGLMRGKSVKQVLSDFAKDQRDTFVGMSPVTDLFVNVAAIEALGTDLNGTPQDSLVEYVEKKVEPGFVGMVKRGMKRGFLPEAATLLTGSRAYDYDVEKSVGIESSIFSNRLSDNTRAMHRQMRNEDKAEGKKLYAEAESIRRDLFDAMHRKAKAASDLGLPRHKIEKMLNAVLSKEMADAVMRGGYIKYDEQAYQEKKAKYQ